MDMEEPPDHFDKFVVFDRRSLFRMKPGFLFVCKDSVIFEAEDKKQRFSNSKWYLIHVPKSSAGSPNLWIVDRESGAVGGQFRTLQLEQLPALFKSYYGGTLRETSFEARRGFCKGTFTIEAGQLSFNCDRNSQYYTDRELQEALFESMDPNLLGIFKTPKITINGDRFDLNLEGYVKLLRFIIEKKT